MDTLCNIAVHTQFDWKGLKPKMQTQGDDAKFKVQSCGALQCACVKVDVNTSDVISKQLSLPLWRKDAAKERPLPETGD